MRAGGRREGRERRGATGVGASGGLAELFGGVFPGGSWTTAGVDAITCAGGYLKNLNSLTRVSGSSARRPLADTLSPRPASMAQKIAPAPAPEFTGLDDKLSEQLPTFELFFKTFGFKRVHGRIWGLLVLAGQPLSSREISAELSLSQGATSTALNELTEWGAIHSDFDSTRRCHLHAPVGNTLSIVATVFRRREQVVFGKLRVASKTTLEYVKGRYGEKDPRVLTLRSILTSLDIADAVMQLVFSSVERALGDSESILSRAVNAALKVGMKAPPRVKEPDVDELLARLPADDADEADEDEDEVDPLPRKTLRPARSSRSARPEREVPRG